MCLTVKQTLSPLCSVYAYKMGESVFDEFLNSCSSLSPCSWTFALRPHERRVGIRIWKLQSGMMPVTLSQLHSKPHVGNNSTLAVSKRIHLPLKASLRMESWLNASRKWLLCVSWPDVSNPSFLIYMTTTYWESNPRNRVFTNRQVIAEMQNPQQISVRGESRHHSDIDRLLPLLYFFLVTPRWSRNMSALTEVEYGSHPLTPAPAYVFILMRRHWLVPNFLAGLCH